MTVNASSDSPLRTPLRSDLEGLRPYGAPQDDVPIRLNVNENPFPPPPALCAAIAEGVRVAARHLNRYPDRDFPALRAALAEYLQEDTGVRLDPDQIWAGNGSNEVMLHLLQAYGGPGRVLLATTPSYSMYPEYARDTCTDYVAVARSADFTVALPALLQQVAELHPALVVIPSPNNPTGTASGINEISQLLDACRGAGPGGADTIVVIDEAYAEFRRDGVQSALTLLAQHPHLVVTRTMSKAFGAAGLRLGYLAADPRIIANLMVVRLPYHLSALTQAAALAALEQRGELRAQVQVLRAERDRVALALREHGYTVAPSDANFIMFGVFDDTARIFAALRERGILLRVVGPPGWLRMSIGTPEENDAVLAVLPEVACPVQETGRP